MRFVLATSLCAALCLPVSGRAGDNPPAAFAAPTPNAPAPASDKQPADKLLVEAYRGHLLDFTEIAGRKDFTVMVDRLKHQVDMVEQVAGLSPRVLEFFRTIPVTVNELGCLSFTKDSSGKDLQDPKQLLHPACYAASPPQTSRLLSYGSIWDSEQGRWINPDPVALGVDTNLGVIMIRPILLGSPAYADRPALLHELLHAYHNLKLPQGFKNAGIQLHFDQAKEQKPYPQDAYLMSNTAEFFAVTASVFLYGNDGPFSRADLKAKQPDYYKYLVYLFGYDPDPSSNPSPVASAD
ncbi:hypothetical protein ACQR1W_08285 [Bradyrhizobium sp. HKCCYLS1011]|uniref:hypothetical protein n=1 Tax=Bradyrhizobium sp. HKCCYLS1011 TaxID=3420733 RepID=UPI003EB70F4D